MYADRLEETEDPVRVAQLERAERSALGACETQWTDGLPRGVFGCTWGRGFVEGAGVSLTGYLRRGAALHAATPFRLAYFRGRGPIDLGQLAGRVHFAGLRRVIVPRIAQAAGFGRFADSPNVRLRALHLTGGGFW